jgi:predicted amidohydrolase YtcJ
MPPNPFEVLYFLVIRTSRYGEVVGSDERISRQDALELVTINNAYITFEERLKGSIEQGKLADFVVLDRDYLSVPESDIKDIKPHMTVVGGKVVFEAGAPAGR